MGEICGTFTQQSTTYPFIRYTEGSSQKALFIVRSQANGGNESILTTSNRIDFITMSSVISLNPGAANWSGEYATPHSTAIPWPQGLTNGAGACGEALTIIDLDTPKKKLLITNPMIYHKMKKAG